MCSDGRSGSASLEYASESSKGHCDNVVCHKMLIAGTGVLDSLAYSGSQSAATGVTPTWKRTSKAVSPIPRVSSAVFRRGYERGGLISSSTTLITCWFA